MGFSVLISLSIVTVLVHLMVIGAIMNKFQKRRFWRKFNDIYHFFDFWGQFRQEN